MKRKTVDILVKYSKFTWQLKENTDAEYQKYMQDKAKGRFLRENTHKLVETENRFFLLSYLFNPIPALEKEIEYAIRKGRYIDGKIEAGDFLNLHPELILYQHILLKDKSLRYNIGYLTERIRLMIKTFVELNIFFLDTYILCKVMDKIFNWKQLEQTTQSKTRLRIGFNNILMVGYEDDTINLSINDEGLRKFDSYRSDKITLGLYSGDDLLHCRKISVPVFKQDNRARNFNQDVRAAIYKDDIGGEKTFDWSVLLPAPESDEILYKEILEWMAMVEFTSDSLKNKN